MKTQISRFTIRNILGIEYLEYEAGKFNTITGGNGKAKTSVLESLKSVFAGGQDATLLRKGAKTGEIVILLDDGTKLQKRVTPGNQVTKVTKDGVEQKNPMSYIRQLTDMMSVNPVEFLRAPDKDRVNVLLDSLPMKADPIRLEEIIGSKPDEKLVTGDAMTVIARVRQSVFEDRTGTNRAIREKDATINQLQGTLPAGQQTAAAGDLAGLEAERKVLDDAKDAELERVRTKLDGLRTASEQAKDTIRNGHEEAIADVRLQIEALQAQITALQADIAAEQQTCATEVAAETTRFANVERLAGTQRENTITKHTAAREPISAQIESIRSNQDAAARHARTREIIKTMQGEAEGLRSDAERQTAAIEGLDAYKSELLNALPIDGLVVEDGRVMRHGIPFDRLNTAQQVDIAVEVAKLRAGELGLILVDGIEALSSQTFAAFRDKAIASGLQMFVSRVTEGELGLRAEG